ncbi:Protein AAR2 [Liparis tanakae]|uniref:Protein AAR2 homolog n=1 Tax=Liparis tanakae TaxID=230148 RepID=A0A4Z2FA14_9TELE|nr:Protein AAR2 [Liparis tanakae]
MDPEVALRLFEEGATLVLLGVPLGTELGIDCKSWQVGPRFKGVKMIPPGLHFLHFSSVSSPSCGGEAGPKTGLFLSLRPRDLLLATWDPEEEDLDFSASQSEEEVLRVRAGLRDLDPFLGPYPYAALRKWVSLTDRLSGELAERLRPLSGRVRALGDVVPERQLASTEERAAQPRNDAACRDMREGLARLPRMKPRDGTEMRFSVVPEKKYPPGAAPAEVTRCSLDHSDALEALLRRHYPLQPLQLLGELQFAFVCFLLGGAYDCFEHWKSLLALLCRSGAAVRTHAALYRGLVAVLYHQLGEVPRDFFVDIVSQSNFLTSTLQVSPTPVKSFQETSPTTSPQHRRDSDRYCQLCNAWFNNPGMAQQHYDGKKHKKNAARADLLEHLGKTLDMGEMKETFET